MQHGKKVYDPEVADYTESLYSLKRCTVWITSELCSKP